MAGSWLPWPTGVSWSAGGCQHACLPRPYVLKPVRKARASVSSSCARITSHPPQEFNDPGWAFGSELLAERYIPGAS